MMIYPILALACALLSALTALALQFRLPGWRVAAGLAGRSERDLANVDQRWLARALSIVFHLLALALACVAAFMYVKLFPQRYFTAALVVPVWVSLNVLTVVYRSFDRNARSREKRLGDRLVVIGLNVLCLLIALAI